MSGSVQFSSVSQSCLTLCDPMDCSMPGLPVHHQLPEFTQTRVHRVGDAIQPSHLLSSPSLLPSIFPSIRVFSNESALHISLSKYWSFNFNISPFEEHSGLISFRMDWLDLLAVQGTLKSLFQHHSWKASQFWQNVVHWRREWQTSSVFLPWELHEQYEKKKKKSQRVFQIKLVCFTATLWSYIFLCSTLKFLELPYTAWQGPHPPSLYRSCRSGALLGPETSAAAGRSSPMLRKVCIFQELVNSQHPRDQHTHSTDGLCKFCLIYMF